MNKCMIVNSKCVNRRQKHDSFVMDRMKTKDTGFYSSHLQSICQCDFYCVLCTVYIFSEVFEHCETTLQTEAAWQVGCMTNREQVCTRPKVHFLDSKHFSEVYRIQYTWFSNQFRCWKRATCFCSLPVTIIATCRFFYSAAKSRNSLAHNIKLIGHVVFSMLQMTAFRASMMDVVMKCDDDIEIWWDYIMVFTIYSSQSCCKDSIFFDALLLMQVVRPV